MAKLTLCDNAIKAMYDSISALFLCLQMSYLCLILSRFNGAIITFGMANDTLNKNTMKAPLQAHFNIFSALFNDTKMYKKC